MPKKDPLLDQVAQMTEEINYSEKEKEKLEEENEQILASKKQAEQDKNDLIHSLNGQKLRISRDRWGVLKAEFIDPFWTGVKLILKSMKRKNPWDKPER